MRCSDRITHEKKVVATMITLYCNKNHNIKKQLCTECLELKEYAFKRLDGCKFGNKKSNCGDCKIHCYKNDMRERIIKVMRYSGPRMMIYHPIISVKHLIYKYKKHP
ncbi:nitrous oxide-stimulated promoter family protein [Ruminiclostridium josui]|uniref:nitrous oxide-stimulated promoter family protein n=1 Tax=Ruminiclostridium josui TaxID=1499 RepID=UPI0004650FDA|nr:nitrous oxide-stimulated promoter family protein [Ruminiclostridium josui]